MASTSQTSAAPTTLDRRDGSTWLVAEYCAANFYTGWHIYWRDNPGYQKRNADGRWGWVRGSDLKCPHSRTRRFLAELGCPITGDGTCDHDGIAQFARRFPLPGRKVGGKKRGGALVMTAEDGTLSLAPSNT